MILLHQIVIEKLQYIINREAAKCQHYQQANVINMNILQLKKYYLLIKVKQFAYSSLDKKKQKQTKTIEDQRKKSLCSTSYKTC